MGGRSTSSGMSSGGNGTSEPARRLISKSQVDELTADYTPQMFTGNLSTYTGSADNLRYHVENNMPDSLNVGGYEFRKMGDPHISVDGNKNVAMMDYQCTEQIGSEFPVLQVGVRAWRTRGGRIKSEIIRDGYTYKTRFW